MAKRMGFGLFFLVFLTIFGGLHYYVWLNFSRILPQFSLALAILLVLLASAYPVSQMSKVKFSWLRLVGSVWLGLLSLVVVSFALKDLLGLVWPIGAMELPAALAALGLAGLAYLRARRGPVLRHLKINQGILEPLRIVHLSDLHLGSNTDPAWLKGIARKVNSLEPDLVAITGDLVDDSFPAVEGFAPIMAQFRAKHGVYAVSGNHEHYRGIDGYHRFCEAANISALDNKRVTLAGGITLVGIDDTTAREKEAEQKLAELLADHQPGQYNILLIHQPVGFPQAATLGIHLQLSGHTHRGQFFPFNLLVPLFYRYHYGLYSLGSAHIYTSSGTGTWGPPLRLGSDSEIVLLEIKTG